MKNQIDIALTLRKIENRKTVKTGFGGSYQAAAQMIDAAKEFIRKPTIKTLQDFVRVEAAWMSLNPNARTSYAAEFRRSLKPGALVPGSAQAAGLKINSAWNSNYAPTRGFIYAFWSESRAAHLKIGSTSRHPQDRLAEFIKRHPAYGNLKIIYLAEVTYPVEVERRLSEALSQWRRKLHRGDSIEWYQITPKDGVEKIDREIFLSGVKVVGQRFVDKDLDTKTAISRRAMASANLGLLPGLSNYVDQSGRRVIPASPRVISLTKALAKR